MKDWKMKRELDVFLISDKLTFTQNFHKRQKKTLHIDKGSIPEVLFVAILVMAVRIGWAITVKSKKKNVQLIGILYAMIC